MNKLCTICARAGSKGVPNKNIRPLAGKPLIVHSILQAKASQLFQHIVVSTDSDEIADIAIKHGAEVFFKRSPELSSDTAGKLDVIKDAFKRSEVQFNQSFDLLVDLDATSPLRSIDDINQAVQLMQKHSYENLFSVAPSRRSPYFNLVEQDELGHIHLSKSLDKSVKRRQDAPKTYDMNASIYAWTRDCILNSEKLFLQNTGLLIMPEERSHDIDSELDFKVVEFLMREQLKL